MSRPSRSEAITPHRERLKQDAVRAAPLREQYPKLAEVRVELSFIDRVSPPPSPQAFSYFPSARGFFRYACPCHSCSGEFDVSSYVADLAGGAKGAPQSRQVNILCMGQRLLDRNARTSCAIGAQVLVSITPHPEKSA